MRIIVGDWHFWDEGMDWEQSFEAIKELGVDGIELGIREPHKELTKDKIDLLKDLQEKIGIKIEVIDFFMNPVMYRDGGITSGDEKVRKNTIEGMKIVADAASELGVKTMGLWLGADRVSRYKDYHKQWEMVVTEINDIAEYCKSKGVKLCFEYKPGEVINNSDALLRLFESVNSDNLGALLDVGHATMQGEDEVIVLDKLKNNLVHIHLDDNYCDYDRDMPPGMVHNFQPFIQRLHDIDYKGFIGLDTYYFIAEGFMGSREALELGLEYTRQCINNIQS